MNSGVDSDILELHALEFGSRVDDCEAYCSSFFLSSRVSRVSMIGCGPSAAICSGVFSHIHNESFSPVRL